MALVVGAALALLPAAALAAAAPGRGPSEAVFLCDIVALLACGRLLGELMQRVGQPAVMGQLIAGIVLGPSVLGAAFPDLQHALFPKSAEQKAMIDAVAQLGILMLLLLTGMETDLTVFRRSRVAAVAVSLFGIALPFACGIGLGLALPASLLPDPGKRLVTTLFLGTALAISSVKIVAMVVRDIGFLRRTVGQVIVGAAIIDDTIGWIIISITFGIALHGGVELGALAKTVAGTAVFLALSFTIGRRVVFRIIRWANDRFVSELPVITAILVVTGVMALLTDAIGVHTVLGAFVAGVLIGQSPILTQHIEEQLRGLIVALFMPVFFGLAGLSTDLSILADTSILGLTLALIAIASLGKFSGAFLGGRLGGMSWGEALALGCGMNARGSTEVIVASIGLSMGALNQSLYSMIVAMAIVTTMSMPPLLRWALGRLPLRPDERARIERDEFEAKGFLPQIERLLVTVDGSPGGELASRLAGLMAGLRQIPTTVLHLDEAKPALKRGDGEERAARTKDLVTGSAEGVPADEEGDAARNVVVDVTAPAETAPEKAVAAEARKGYDLLVIGREPIEHGGQFHDDIARSAAEFGGPFGVVVARGEHRRDPLGKPLDIVVAVNGTIAARQGAELGIALARASHGRVTALHAAEPKRRRSWRPRLGAALASSAEAIIRETVRLGEPYSVEVRGIVRRGRAAEDAILRQLKSGGYNLLVMGVSPRPGEQLSFGHVAAELLERAPCSILFVSSDPLTATDDKATGKKATGKRTGELSAKRLARPSFAGLGRRP